MVLFEIFYGSFKKTSKHYFSSMLCTDKPVGSQMKKAGSAPEATDMIQLDRWVSVKQVLVNMPGAQYVSYSTPTKALEAQKILSTRGVQNSGRGSYH